MAKKYQIAIMRFDDRNRYGQNGIPSTILFGGGKKWIVECKKATKLNQWAKVEIKDENRAELIEILGPIGDRSVELMAMQLHFDILPCRYPKEWNLLSFGDAQKFPRDFVDSSAEI